ncbi:MAG: cysteine desulfurase [Bacteroidetes bacterium]|nr:cysteine desulfurase [Bacteroidota bacterium]
MKTPFDAEIIRKDFPAISLHNLAYFDNAATAHKPQVVIDTIRSFYTTENANVHRAVHHLSQQATFKYEESRKIVADFINAANEREIIFTRGTTEGINLVAFSYGSLLEAGDEILISTMEHHSNIVPWQMLCERKNCVLKVIPINPQGEIIEEKFEELLNEKTRLVAITHISNTLGTINPVKRLVEKAHKTGAKVLIDGAQSAQHLCIDVRDLDCDFFVFSGHKAFGPTGIGVLYAKEAILEKMPPYQTGGEMIESVSFSKTTFNSLPFKFEAGTPHIAGAIGLASALQYISQFDRTQIAEYEKQLLYHAERKLSEIENIRFFGQSKNKASILSFNIKNVHPYDLGVLLDKQGVAVRTGHHCTEPLMDFFGIPGTVRASFAFYNTFEEIEKMEFALKKSLRLLL